MNWEGNPMAAVFRIVSLIGVMSAGFYVLYLTQARMSEPQTLTEPVSKDPAPVKLGAEGELAELSNSKSRWNTVEANPASSDSDVPGGTDGPEMFSATSNPASTEVSDTAPGSVGGLSFRDAAEVEGGTTESGLGIVTAAMESSGPEVITLTANENPFTEDDPQPPAETETPPPLESIDPFADPPTDSETPTPEPETEPAEFDPFGEDKKLPEPFTPEKTSDEKTDETSADDFPGLGEPPAQPKPADSDTSTAPVTAEDPFAPFAEESSAKPDETDTVKPVEEGTPPGKPAVSSDPFKDPFPDLPAEERPAKTPPAENNPTAPKPVPAENPFDDPFPELKPNDEKPAEQKPLDPIEAPAPSLDPFGTGETKPESPPATPSALPDFPGELPKTEKPMEESADPQPPKTLESGFNPFAEETPAPKLAEPAEKPQPTPAETDAFPPFDPVETTDSEPQPGSTEFSEREIPSRTDALPSLDQFPDLDEKLMNRAKETEGMHEAAPAVEPSDEFSEDTPEPLPSLDDASPGSPSDEADSSGPAELKSAPTGIVPSLTDLQGDGVLRPDTPRKVQLPYLEIHKNAPSKALLNQPFVYTILIKNVGEAAANEVTVQDQIPKGTNLTGTIPQAELVGRRLVWKLGRIEPGAEQKVAVRVVPVESGPIGSVATVNFVAEVGAETVVEQSEVAFQMKLPPEANVGDVVECQFEIVNRGSQVVSGIVLRDIMPEGLHHPAGNDLENPLGDLKPGEKLSESLELKVMKAGEHVNQAVLTAEGGLEIKQEARLEAAANRLALLRRGPKERFVGRPAIYHNVVKNSSQEPVRNVVVIEKLPAGMQFVQAGQGGQYHAASREVYWKIAELGRGQTVTLDIQMTPLKAGVGESLVRVRESQGKEIQAVSHTQVRSYASIGLNVTEFDQPILVGDTVVMRVEATNRGNAAAKSVQFRAKIPPTLQLMNVRGRKEMEFQVMGREVVFKSQPELPAGASEVFELELQAAAPSKVNVEVSVQTKGMAKPFVKAASLPVHSRQ
jgi:uncharacterized repeat protein (TIGR01451 family)